MLPAYGMNSAYLIFFLSYMIIGLYFLLSLVMAIIYVNYKLLVEDQNERFYEPRNEFLKIKFENFPKKNEEFLTKEECKNLIENLISKLNFKNKHLLDIDFIVTCLDTDNNNSISLEEFQNIFNAINKLVLVNKYKSRFEN